MRLLRSHWHGLLARKKISPETVSMVRKRTDDRLRLRNNDLGGRLRSLELVSPLALGSIKLGTLLSEHARIAAKDLLSSIIRITGLRVLALSGYLPQARL